MPANTTSPSYFDNFQLNLCAINGLNLRFRFKAANLIIFCLAFWSTSYSQQNKKIELQFNPTFKRQSLALDSIYYHLNQTDSVQFTVLKFYISNISLFADSQLVFREENSFHLIDASLKGSLMLPLSVPQSAFFNTIKFNLGIDSTTNVSGALENDLDPTKGMYWTWQSGYINFKLEGNSNQCKTRKNEFKFHLGGYLAPFEALRKITLPVQHNHSISIDFPLDLFLSKLDLSVENEVMIPGYKAMLIATKAAAEFKSDTP